MTVAQGITLLVLLVVNFPAVWFVSRYVATPRAKRVYGLDVPLAQKAREQRNAVITTPVHALILAVCLISGLLRTSESVTSFAWTFVATFLWTEVWHYVSHIAMHMRPLHFIHREHHLSMITGPWTSVSFSFLEKLIFSLGIVLPLALASAYLSVSFFGIAAYYLLYFVTNTLGHANIEIRAPGYYRTWLGKIFNTPAYHAMHHARYVGNYGLLTPWLDQLFGTAWPDFGEVQTRAASGRPLQRLQERLDGVKA